MAFSVLILKEKEDSDRVLYRFSPDEKQFGLLELNKHDGTVKEIEPVPTKNPSAFFIRASVKVRQHWKKGNFPEVTCWAS